MEDLTQELYSPDFFLANNGRAEIAIGRRHVEEIVK